MLRRKVIMFLAELLENEKKLFWELANELVFVDGQIEDGEIEMMEAYRKELGDESYLIEKPSCTIGKIPASKNVLEEKKKKIIYFELLGLAYADKEYVDSEKIMLHDLKKEFHISDADEKDMQEIIEKITDSYLKLGKILNE